MGTFTFSCFLVAWCITMVASSPYYHPPSSTDQATVTPPYAPWAHYHWIWLDSSRSNQSNIFLYMQYYDYYNISFGAIDIDSGWSTGYNNFQVDTTKFPAFPSLISSIHTDGRRVILWATSMVDTDCNTFNYSLQNEYFIKDGFNQSAIIAWWHGNGGFLDYFNPSALQYWQSQLNNVITIPSLNNEGIDGFKVDGSDAYIIELLTPLSYQGPITYRDYADQYYRNFLYYTRQFNNESLIWSRPVDSFASLPLNLSIFLPYSPKDVMFSGWVGDQDPTFEGLRAAAINVLESAWENYTNFGTDTGGYRGGNRTRELFLRWSQYNTFLPLFENGGDDEHEPWAFDGVTPDDTTASDLYRRLVNIHYELVPYFYTTGCTRYRQNLSSIIPLSSPPSDFPFPIQPDDITDWSYTLGETMYVSPIVYENMTSIRVTLPRTKNGQGWYDYYNPSNTFPSGGQLVYPSDLDPALSFMNMTSAVFVQQSSLLPLHVSTPHGLVPYGTREWSTALTIMVQNPIVRSSAITTTEKDTLFVQNFGTPSTVTIGTEVSLQCWNNTFICHVEATAFNRPLILVYRWTNGSIFGTVDRTFPKNVSLSSLNHKSWSLPLLSKDIFYAGRKEDQRTFPALSWDTTSIDGGKYPIKDMHTILHSSYEENYGNHYYYVPAEESVLGIHELYVFVSRLDMVTGIDIDVQF